MSEHRFGFSRKLPPSKCPDCDAQLGRLKYGVEFDQRYRRVSPSFVDGSTHYRECTCGCVVVWSWPNVWMRRHVLPLLDDRLVVLECP